MGSIILPPNVGFTPLKFLYSKMLNRSIVKISYLNNLSITTIKNILKIKPFKSSFFITCVPMITWIYFWLLEILQFKKLRCGEILEFDISQE
ncbi:hypothetical protein LSP_04955 [Lysinibacillus sphaericus]|nr:hypothetical protein LSP_04955 [Lysinibacillus sphaericus]